MAYVFVSHLLGHSTSWKVDFCIRNFLFLLLSKMVFLKGRQMCAFGYSFWTTVVTVSPAEVQTHSFLGIVRYIGCRLSLQT